MQFPYSYFDDEVRDGFFVPGLMKRSWAAQLEVLEDIAKVCKKHNIKWFADCGTLLGAVRHKGFIPWDDDMDICMLRDDYMRFVSIAEKELPENYSLLNIHTDKEYSEMLSRVVNSKQIHVDAEFLEKYHNFPFMAGVDIFPLDYVAPTEEEENLRKQVVAFVAGKINTLEDDSYSPEEKEQMLLDVEEVCKIKIDRKGNLKRQLLSIMEGLFSIYNKEEATEVALMPYWVEKNNHKYPLEYFEHIISIPFETTEIYVPAAYDGVLRIEYGDYMKLVRGGAVHDYPYYGEAEQKLRELTGQLPFKETFSISDLDLGKRVTRKKPKEQIKNYLQLMSQANEKVKEAIRCQQVELAMGLVESCQNGTIQIGTLVEKIEGEGFTTVKCLEEYCELLYCLYKKIVENQIVDLEQDFIQLQGQLNKISQSMQQDMKERKEVIFVTDKASKWDAFESVWKAATNDTDCDVYVIAIPYYDKKPDGSFGEMHYEGKNYPSNVPITDYENFDFAQHYPDVIFIQNPYDNSDLMTSVHPFFYSTNLRQFTDRLVYIPYFVIEEISTNDELATQSMGNFVTVPGVVYADQVIVQSEQMRQAYIECMTEFAGVDTKQIWEEKIAVIELLETCSSQNEKKEDLKIPEDWKKFIQREDGSYKKIVLYNVGISALLQYDKRMIEKMRRVFQVFRKNQNEIILLWKQHPLIKVTLSVIRPLLWEDYKKLVEQYVEGRWGIYDDSTDLDWCISLCDAYYGDGSSEVQLCRNGDKPVMIQNVNS